MGDPGTAAKVVAGNLDWEPEDCRWTDENGQTIQYPIWDSKNSFVRSGPLGPVTPASNWRGRRFHNRAAARKYWEQKMGEGCVVESYFVPFRWVFRIKGVLSADD